MLEKTLKLLDSLDCQACGRVNEIPTKGICAPSCGSEYRLDDEIEKELSELEAKAAKWDDPQTQENLKLAAAVREFCKRPADKLYYYDFMDNLIEITPEEFIEWHREQKRGE